MILTGDVFVNLEHDDISDDTRQSRSVALC